MLFRWHFLCLIVYSFSVLATPLDMPTTNVSIGYLPAPTVSNLKNLTVEIEDLMSVSLGVEVPIYSFLNGGVNFQTLFPLKKEESTDMFDKIKIRVIADLSPFIRLQLPFDTPAGRFTPYSFFSAGPTVSLWADKRYEDLFAKKSSNPGLAMLNMGLTTLTNFGVQGTALVGVSYFPIWPIGVFVEAGYRANLFWVNHTPFEKDEKNTLERGLMHSPVISGGLKIAL